VSISSSGAEGLDREARLEGPAGAVEPPAGVDRVTEPPPRQRQYGVVIGLVLMIVLFSALNPDAFLTTDNLISILSAGAILTILAVGLTAPLAAGDFDLSIAAVASLAGMVVATLVVDKSWAVPAALLVAVLIGVGVGVINGLMVAYVRINAFVATLAMMSVLTGLSLGVAGERYRGLLPTGLTDIGQTKVIGIPIVVFMAAVVAVVLWGVLRSTQFGRYVYATGSNEMASSIAGVNTRRIRLSAFVISGGLAAVAGALLVARAGSAYPDGAGGLLLPAYAAAFVGASVLSDGRFHVGGTVVGVLLLQAGQTGLIQSDVAPWLTDVFNGAVLALAVALTRVSLGGLFSKLTHGVRGR
jgi:ribose transport system permease protein